MDETRILLSDPLVPADIIVEKLLQDRLAENLHLVLGPDSQTIEKEYQVPFGRLDILARDGRGSLVVLELKRGAADRAAIGQLQSYIGAIREKFPAENVRGVLVASGMDDAARAAFSVANDLEYFRFEVSLSFSFSRVASSPNSKVANDQNHLSKEKSVEVLQSDPNIWEVHINPQRGLPRTHGDNVQVRVTNPPKPNSSRSPYLSTDSSRGAYQCETCKAKGMMVAGRYGTRRCRNCGTLAHS